MAKVEAVEGFYVYSGSSACKKCGAMIEWWKTPPKPDKPKGANMCLNLVEGAPEPAEGTRIPSSDFHLAIKPRVHWETCPGAEDIKRETAERRANEPGPASPSRPNLAQELDEFFARMNPDQYAGAVFAFEYIAKVARRFKEQTETRIPF